MTAEELIRLIGLKPHPEGGFYRESYRGAPLPGFSPERASATAIYYLLVPGAVSKLHRLKNDEVFHFYMGDPVTWIWLTSKGVKEVTLGSDLGKAQTLQMTVPAGTWFGGSLGEGGKFALMGTTVAPGFEFEDFELGDRAKLLESYPACREEIFRLT